MNILLIKKFKEFTAADYRDNLKDLNNFNLKNSRNSNKLITEL